MAIPQNNVKAIFNANAGRVQLPFNEGMAELSCPFGMYLGFSLNTPDGGESWNAKVTDSATYQRVMNGSDSVSLLWEHANKIENKKLIESIGKINTFYITNDSIRFEQGTLASTNDLVTTQAVGGFDAYSAGGEFGSGDVFKLHMFPRRFGRQLFIAEVLETHRDTGGDTLYQKITFKSLQNELATSGLAIEQFVQFGAVGHEYAMPKWDGAKNTIVLEEKHPFKGVNEVQIEFYGNVAPISIAFMGRDVNADVDKNDLIVPCVMLPPKPSAFSNSALPSTNFYIAENMQLSLNARYEDYKKAISASSNSPFEKRQFEGIFKFISARTTTQSEKDGKYTQNILANLPVDKALDISHIPTQNNYFNKTDASRDPLTAFTKQSPISTLWRNHLNYQHITELPMSEKTSVKFNLTQVPILGGLINTLTLGLLPDMPIRTGGIKSAGIPALVESQSVDHASIIFPITDSKSIPSDFFRNDDSGEMASVLSTKALNTCLRFSLTKQFADKELDEYSATSAEAYTFLEAFDGTKPKKFKDNTNAVHVDGKLEDYIISQMQMKVIGAADYRLTFFRNGVSTWTGRYQTKAKRSSTGSIHQIQHVMMLDPINRIDGAAELMHVGTPFDIDKQFLTRATSQVAIHKTYALYKSWKWNEKPDSSVVPLNPVFYSKEVIPLSKFNPAIGTVPDDVWYIVKGNFDHISHATGTTKKRYELRVQKVGKTKDSDMYEVNYKNHLTRFGVQAEIVGDNLEIYTIDTGVWSGQRSSGVAHQYLQQDISNTIETVNIAA